MLLQYIHGKEMRVMESKVQEYQALYSKFEEALDCAEEFKEPVEQLKTEIDQLRQRQQQYDYTDANIVIQYMESHIDSAIKEKKQNLQTEVKKQMQEITNTSDKVKKNFEKVTKWLNPKEVDKIVSQNTVDYSQEIDMEKAKNNAEFDTFSSANKIFGFIFRFNFLTCFPKVIRVIAAIIIWGIILIPKIVDGVYNKISLKNGFYTPLTVEEYEKMIHVSITRVVLIVGIIIFLNLAFYYATKYSAKNYILKNQLLYLAITEPQKLEKSIYDYKLSVFINGTVSNWKNEIEYIKNNGLLIESQESEKIEHISSGIVETLTKNYDKLSSDIAKKEVEMENCISKADVAMKGTEDLIDELNSKEKEVIGLIGDCNHNNGVLSPYVALGFANDENYGVKELVSFKHNYKPMLICYDEESAQNSEKLRKNIAILVEKFMTGFFGESSMDIIDMYLVDFEGLHFPESRTRGMMKVIRTQRELQNLYTNLKNTRDLVNSLADGKIATINPDKLRKRENPIKYSIVFFTGADFASIDRETVQLFIEGENFGFIPILFMKQTIARDLLSEDNSTRAFSKVIKKIKESEQIYGYEGIINEFEYELIISNQKKSLEEKLCVRKILSFKEFEDILNSEETISVKSSLYVDTNDISEELYKYFTQYDFVEFFTVNGIIPDFVTTNIKKL